jgi:hypothetical protein
LIPQRPLGAQDAAALDVLPDGTGLAPCTLAEKVESFFLTSRLPQVGQVTSAAALLRTNFSNAPPQVGQTYS